MKKKKMLYSLVLEMHSLEISRGEHSESGQGKARHMIDELEMYAVPCCAVPPTNLTTYTSGCGKQAYARPPTR